MEIRQATAEDDRVIKRMVRGAGINPFQLDWPHFLLVVEDGGRVIACAQVKRHGDGTRELASLVVVKERRGQGLARMLIESLMQMHGAPLYLTCRRELEPLYRRFGFTLLTAEDLTPFFRRLSRLAGIFSALMRRPNQLAVMLWDGRRS